MEEHFIKIHKWLYPASWLYGAVVGLRNKLFDWGTLRSKSFDVPVICIGNLSVGGTGKTPHTEYLIKLLQKEFNVAVLSRGYKRRTKGYILADASSTAQNIGDEPFQIRSKFPGIRVAVDEKRCHGIEQLLALESPTVETVLLDDAFQHRYVKAGLNILLTDYHRLFCDDALLPAGRLRESAAGKQRAHIVIVTKCPRDMKPITYTIIKKKLDLLPYQQLYFSTFRYGKLKPLFSDTGGAVRDLTELKTNEHILLFTGIASPAPLLSKLKKHTRYVDSLIFADHHDFTTEDLKKIQARFEQLTDSQRLIVTTEKDATRLAQHSAFPEELTQHIYIFPVEIEILQNQQVNFNKRIIGYVRENQRNS